MRARVARAAQRSHLRGVFPVGARERPCLPEQEAGRVSEGDGCSDMSTMQLQV